MKKLLSILLFFSVFVTDNYAQVVVTPGTFPTMCQGGDYVTQTSDIIIRETNPGDFNIGSCSGGSFALKFTIPTQNLFYEFEVNSGTITSAANGDIVLQPFVGTYNIRTDYFCNSNTKIDTIRISGVRVRAKAGAPTTQNLYRNGEVPCVAQQTGNNVGNAVIHTTLNSVPNPNPTISVSGLPPLICSNNSTNYPITFSHTGGGTGVLSGSGISGTNFVPSLAAIGNDTLKYTVSNSGCNFVASTVVTVYQAPIINFVSSDADNIICEGDAVTFTANTSGTGTRYLFLKNSNGIQGPNSSDTYTTSSLANGDIVSVTVDNGANTCVATSAGITTTVGKLPKAYFKWNTACGSSLINLDDSSYVIQAGSTVTKWYWDYENDNNYNLTGTTNDHSYNYNAYGNYIVKLKAETNYGCTDSTTQKISLQATKIATISNPYIENFTADDGGWANLGSNSTWKWGAAFGDSLGVGSRPVWATGSVDGKYNVGEVSYLQSPCFNLSGLDKPMISIKLRSRATSSLAGAMLEASVDGGVSWNFVGKVGLGVNWYNYSGINGLANVPPAQNHGDNEGWSGYDTTWKVARIALDKFAGNPTVKFRISFGAVTLSVARTFGIGIDSVWLGNRSKRLVLEHFTNTIAANQPGGGKDVVDGENAVNVIRDKRKKDVSAVYYHCSFPAADIYNNFYQDGPSSRVLTYGVTAAPRTVLDGTYYNGRDYFSANAASRIDTNDIDSRALEKAIFKMDLTTIFVPGKITAAVRVKYDVPNSTLFKFSQLHIIVVEDSVDVDNKYSSVVRQMLPDASGNNITKTWNYQDSVEIVRSWNHSLSSTKLGVVAFLQDQFTNEIHQSVYIRGQGSTGSVVSGLWEAQGSTNELLVFPNPADQEISIVLISESEEIGSWSLIDNLGREIKNTKLNSHLRGVSISTSDMESGIYTLKVSTARGALFLKKIIITH